MSLVTMLREDGINMWAPAGSITYLISAKESMAYLS